VRARPKSYHRVLICGLAATVLCGSVQAALSSQCRPNHLKPLYFLKNMGPCKFDIDTLSFSGTPVDQALCLTRGMDATRNLGPPLAELPAPLASRVGQNTGLPSREALSGYLSKLDLEWEFAAYLWQPLAHAHDNDPDAPMAKYFVIHDTSGPVYGHFPADIDFNPKINNLQSFVCSDEWGKAHVVINRMGGMLLDHELSTPWRETKFEQAAEFGGALKGLFLHTELIQPRRRGSRGDGHSPDPAFTAAQYDRLALLYVVASVRAGRWLIPAFHAALDADIRNGHDDPLNFSIQTFADDIEHVVAQLSDPTNTHPAAPTATEPAPEAVADAALAGWVDAEWGNRKKGMLLAKAAAPAPGDDQSLNPPASENGQTVTDTLVGSAAVPAANPPTSAKLVPPNAMVAPAKVVASAADCTTRIVRGHRRRICEPAHADGRDNGAQATRTADRDVSHDGHSGRRGAGELRARHARASSRRPGA
jgi:hypothetical protein